MPIKPPLPLEDANRLITDMLSALASDESPGFSKYAISASTLRLHSSQRINKEGKVASEEEVSRGKFNARTLFRMKVDERMLNQLGNLHGGANATIVDNLTSMAVYLHLPDLDPHTPWAFLGVTQSLSVVYLAAIPLDSWIEIECNIVSIGARIVVIAADIWTLEETDEDDGRGARAKRASSGTHTKVDNSLAASKL